MLYPMQAESRRRERRARDRRRSREPATRSAALVLDLTHHETAGRFLEGTGSLVLDHRNRVAYANDSPRTHPDVVRGVGLGRWATSPCSSSPPIASAAPIYHTNVLLCVGERVAVVGTGAMPPKDRGRVVERLKAGGRE